MVFCRYTADLETHRNKWRGKGDWGETAKVCDVQRKGPGLTGLHSKLGVHHEAQGWGGNCSLLRTAMSVTWFPGLTQFHRYTYRPEAHIALFSPNRESEHLCHPTFYLHFLKELWSSWTCGKHLSLEFGLHLDFLCNQNENQIGNRAHY